MFSGLEVSNFGIVILVFDILVLFLITIDIIVYIIHTLYMYTLIKQVNNYIYIIRKQVFSKQQKRDANIKSNKLVKQIMNLCFISKKILFSTITICKDETS